MRILALETTERVATVAAAQGGEVLVEQRLPSHLRSAQALAPAIGELLDRVDWKPDHIQLVAITTGPGSFTGLRIGMATAKAFAYAVGAEILGIDTHETLASACPADVLRLATAIDAQRGQLAVREFARNAAGVLVPQTASHLVDAEVWLDSLSDGIRVSGPILQRIGGRLPPGILPLNSDLWHPMAGQVARLAFRDYADGRRDDLWQIVPAYSRPSAAEEKRQRP